MSLYQNDHRSQYQAGASSRTRRQGCVWTTCANGADACTGGRVKKTPDQVLALVKPSEETNPLTPGWSLRDADLAMSRLGVGFVVHTDPWGTLKNFHEAGYYLSVQGDSDQFGNNTCSGDFDGDHDIGIRAGNDARGYWPIDDPICKTMRWEHPDTIKRYAQKFGARIHLPAGHVSFGVFTPKVPLTIPNTSEEPMDAFGIPQSPGIATAKVNTKLYAKSDLSGVGYAIPEGHTKRWIGTVGKEIVVIGHDRSPEVEGKSALYGKADDWYTRETP